MEFFCGWIKNIAFFLVMVTAVIQLIPDNSYRKYIRFFMGLVLALTLLRPVLRMLGKEDAFRDGIAYEAFRQDMEEAQFDLGYLEETEQEMYRRHYERALEQQFMADAEEKQLEIRAVGVSMDEAFEVERVTIREELPGDGEILSDYIVNVYGLKKGQVRVQ